jgi:hypothetical protein
MPKIRSEKDFWAGVVYVVLGAAFYWFGRNYRMGTAARMGPGYFPIVLSSLLMLIGVVSLARAFLRDGEPVTAIAWRPVLLILAGCLAFAFLLVPFGLVPALIALCGISFRASSRFRIDAWTLGGLALFVAFCVTVFVKGLGLPMPIFGSLFEPFLPYWMIR